MWLARIERQKDTRFILMSLGFVKLIPEENLVLDDRVTENYYYFSNVSLTMDMAKKYCSHLYPGIHA